MSQSSSIPPALLSWFRIHGINNYKLVEFNPRKGRYCLSFQDGNKMKFLKWNDKNEQYRVFLQQLELEKKIYIKLDGTRVTATLMPSEMFIIDVVPGAKTLRSKFKELITSGDYGSVCHLFEKVMEKWQSFIKSDIDFLSNVGPSEEYNRYLYSVLLASPMGTSMRKWEKSRNYAILRVLHRLFDKRLSAALNNSLIKRTPIHGDFHLNNILVSEQNDCFLIDFEDAKICLPELELAYMVSQVHLLLHAKRSVRKAIDGIVKGKTDVLTDYKLYRELLRFFDFGIRFNSSFQ